MQAILELVVVPAAFASKFAVLFATGKQTQKT